jgi:hypothetical protein
MKTTNQSYYVLASTNLASPMVQWTCLATNPMTGGQFRFTNVVDLAVPYIFYRVQLR